MGVQGRPVADWYRATFASRTSYTWKSHATRGRSPYPRRRALLLPLGERVVVIGGAVDTSEGRPGNTTSPYVALDGESATPRGELDQPGQEIRKECSTSSALSSQLEDEEDKGVHVLYEREVGRYAWSSPKVHPRGPDRTCI
eukprot:1186980-Prorocentrum_minimum.AAC.4